MVVHHLNCGNMHPLGALLLTGHGGFLDKAHVVCHCLLVELPDRLMLVDTGLGEDDMANPEGRFGSAQAKLLNIENDPTRTAMHQIRAMGYNPEDVRDIVMTHLDFDHSGGLVDFPWATVHVIDIEQDVATHPKTLSERNRYCAAQFAHGPKWDPLMVSGRDRWFGFEYIRPFPEIDREVLMVPLFGHSRGHCGVALKQGDKWLLHAGDAIMSHRELDPVEPDAPLGLRLFEKFVSDNEEAVEANQALLRQLVHEHPFDLEVVCTHDPYMLDGIPPTAPAALVGVSLQ